MHFQMRAQALALLDALEDEKIPRALDYLKLLTDEPARQASAPAFGSAGASAGIEDLLEEPA